MVDALARRMSRRDEEGSGLLMVMGFMTIVLGLVTVVSAVSIRTLTSSRNHVTFEQALDVAESGIDQTLARLQKNANYATVGVIARDFSSEADERNWAKAQVNTLVAAGAVQTTDEGEFVAFKPTNTATVRSSTVYSMGWVPSRTDRNAKQRLIKTEYLFAPYKPTEAILTAGSIDLSGSVLVDSTTGAASGVHSNGSITSLPSDHIAGPVTASGTYDGRAGITNDPEHLSGSNTPLETIPTIDPRYIYDNQVSLYPNSWYDLCPDGTVRRGTSAGPCQNLSTLATVSGNGTYMGWSFAARSGNTPATWTMGLRNTTFAGIFYIYRGNAVINGQTQNHGQPFNATIIAEAQAGGSSNSASCNKLGGDIDWKLADVTAFMPGVVMVAGGDLYDSANNDAGSGLFAAADQVHLHTSSASLTGYLIASDICRGSAASPDTNEIQGVSFHYDETGEAPLMDVIRTTLWLEYVG
jgi:hypothetical protein